MTRGIAQKRRYMIENTTDDRKMIDLVDEIYNDFESRTCENCEYNELLNSGENACSNDYMVAEFNTYPQYPLIVDSDFGCNKFERKN